MSESKGIWTPGLAKVLAGVLIAAIATGLGLYFYLRQRPSDDPPVTVSDGSIHARSKKYGWAPDPQDLHWIRPAGANGPTGDLQPGGCGFDKGESVKFVYAGNTKGQDITPRPGVEWKATITYTKADDSSQPVVEWIDDQGLLNIRDDDGHFNRADDATDPGHRKHKRADNTDAPVTHVRIVGGKITPIDETIDSTHGFSIQVCYK